MITVVEVRVITHVPKAPNAAYVTVLLSDGTSSYYEEEFPSAEAAELFAKGVRAGLNYAAHVEQRNQ